MQKVTYSVFKKEAEAYWAWAESTPIPPIPPKVAREGAGSESRTPLMHYGTVMPVYLAVARYLAALKPGKGARLIELGSGSGRPLTYLKTLFPELEVWGIDYSADGIAYAQKSYGEYGVTFKHVRAQDTSLKDGSFDFVISSHVLEHVIKKEGLDFIKETERLLKPGGYAFIGTPERRRCQELYAKNPGDIKKNRLVPPHEHEYTLPELEKLGRQVFADKNVRVDGLTNPTFHTIFKASIDKVRPSEKPHSRVVNLAYRTFRDKAPRLLFDRIGRTGANVQMKQRGLTFKDVLFDNRIVSSQETAVPDNLLLVCYKDGKKARAKH